MRATIRRLSLLSCIILFLFSAVPTVAQDAAPSAGLQQPDSQPTELAERIRVTPDSSDEAIDQRLTNILEATGWFSEVTVKVDQGIVFLDGGTATEKRRNWAGELAAKILDVTAVVNRIEVEGNSSWDLSPVLQEMQALWYTALQNIPRFVLALVVLLFFWKAARMVVNTLYTFLERRFNPLLRDLASRIIIALTLVLGFYLALQIAGLSGLAATVLGGTGLVGLVAGIAFRDILENYLASILISLRNPFRIGDLVQINEYNGIVEKVTTRGTVLMNLDGNHVQIPNAIVYKTIIRNYTANPNRRDMFMVGIGFENPLSQAQQMALDVVNDHPAVLAEPEALVLVDALGSATVNLKVYFWYDGTVYNGLKVKSSLIRMVKRAFESEKISMPDEAREILFPQGIAVHLQ
ncbi:MAG TPA: mechanosensitive ion channel domain-containing protein, partial [Desulfopila sp.]|nr:mechanosensitive ion channel domain-containing protein [Desulfopila sp.]